MKAERVLGYCVICTKPVTIPSEEGGRLKTPKGYAHIKCAQSSGLLDAVLEHAKMHPLRFSDLDPEECANLLIDTMAEEIRKYPDGHEDGAWWVAHDYGTRAQARRVERALTACLGRATVVRHLHNGKHRVRLIVSVEDARESPQ